jgi:para-nitrobenzyl esterase
MVWLHGGGFTTGSSSSALYDGRRLSLAGDVVVVSINYRLGALGYMAHPVLAGSEGGPCANWGLLDQMAALAWVRDAIGGFGGDPANVTVFGESAGGMSVMALLAAPAAEGLFRRAVVQSGPPVSASGPLAARRAERLVELVGIGAPWTRAELEALGANALVEAGQRLAGELAGQLTMPLAFVPVIDPASLPTPPGEAIESTGASEVDLLIGTTRDEATFFSILDPGLSSMDDQTLVRRVSLIAPGASEELVTAYRDARGGRSEDVSPPALWNAILTDFIFRMPSLQVASAHAASPHAASAGRSYAYLFTWETPLLGGVLGSCHALDVPFVFGTLRERSVAPFSGGGPEAEALSDAMQQAWVAFARSGDPSCDRLGEWPPYDAEQRQTMVLGARQELAEDPRGPERGAWDRLGVHPGTGHHAS